MGADALAAEGVTTHVIGLGTVNVSSLNQAADAGGSGIPGCDPSASTPSCYFQATDAPELHAAYDAIVLDIVSDVCTTPAECQADGLCDVPSLACTYGAVDDGTLCDDGDACTTKDSCQSGACTGADPVTCVAVDDCHDAGTCDPDTGVCSDPELEDGIPCPNGTCQSGVCVVSGPDAGAPDGGGVGDSSPDGADDNTSSRDGERDGTVAGDVDLGVGDPNLSDGEPDNGCSCRVPGHFGAVSWSGLLASIVCMRRRHRSQSRYRHE